MDNIVGKPRNFVAQEMKAGSEIKNLQYIALNLFFDDGQFEETAPNVDLKLGNIGGIDLDLLCVPIVVGLFCEVSDYLTQKGEYGQSNRRWYCDLRVDAHLSDAQ